MTRCSALSRTAQVFTSITSASAGSSVAHVALAAEHPEHELGVGHVHLAAVGLDVDALGHGHRKDSRTAEGRTVTATVTISERPLLVERPADAPDVLHAEIDARAMLRRSGRRCRGTRRTRAAAPRRQRERQRRVAGAEPDRTPEGRRGIGVNSPPRDTSKVLSAAGAALGQEIAVGAGPGPVDRLHWPRSSLVVARSEAPCRRCTADRPADPGRVAIDVDLPVGADQSRPRRTPARTRGSRRPTTPTPA